jgi:hypothetical protein
MFQPSDAYKMDHGSRFQSYFVRRKHDSCLCGLVYQGGIRKVEECMRCDCL